MDFEEIDIPPAKAVRGKISRALRIVCGGPSNAERKRKAHRRMRRAVKTALRTGGRFREPEALTPWVLV